MLEIKNLSKKFGENTVLKNINLNNDLSILAVGDFHQGVLGILASRVCHEYNRPAIIFTKTEEGTYKGSGRSISTINIHSILCSMSDLFVRFGGHKMAVGLEILPENFEEFKRRFNAQIKQTTSCLDFKAAFDYDIEITEDDISLKFINQLKLLEPFGCAHEKPIFMMQSIMLIIFALHLLTNQCVSFHHKNWFFVCTTKRL